MQSTQNQILWFSGSLNQCNIACLYSVFVSMWHYHIRYNFYIKKYILKYFVDFHRSDNVSVLLDIYYHVKRYGEYLWMMLQSIWVFDFPKLSFSSIKGPQCRVLINILCLVMIGLTSVFTLQSSLSTDKGYNVWYHARACHT